MNVISRLAFLLLLTYCPYSSSGIEIESKTGAPKSSQQWLSNGNRGVRVDLRKLRSNFNDFLEKFRAEEGQRPVRFLLPKINHSFFAGRVRLSQGYLKNMATLQTNEFLTYHTDGDTVRLNMPLAFAEFVSGYNNYSIAIGSVAQSGTIFVTSNYHEFKCILEVKVKKNDCKARIVKLKLVRLDDVSLRVSSSGDLDDIMAVVADWLLNRYKNAAIEHISEGIQTQLSYYLQLNGHILCNAFSL